MSKPGKPGTGSIVGSNLAVGSGKRGHVGTPVGQRPIKYPRSAPAGQLGGTARPLTAALDSGVAGARPIGQPNFNVNGRYPGTQSIGRAGTGLPRGPASFSGAARESGLMGAMSLPPRAVKGTFGFWTNHNVQYQLILRKHVGGFDRYIHPAMPVFRLKTEVKDPVTRGLSTIASLPLMNYILRCESVDGEDKTPAEILHDWDYIGIVKRAERNRADSVNGYMETLESVQSLHGEVSAFNVWGTNIKPMTTLWFVLKMVDNIPDEFVLDPLGKESSRVYASHSIPSRSFQFVPWANHRLDRPPDSFVEYYDNGGNLMMGARIKVGRVEWGVSHLNARASRESAWDAHQMVSGAGQIWMLGDNNPYVC